MVGEVDLRCLSSGRVMEGRCCCSNVESVSIREGLLARIERMVLGSIPIVASVVVVVVNVVVGLVEGVVMMGESLAVSVEGG